ncbi:ankyrin repeat domain-containing protein 37 [Brachyhypopomus gauderio]|uniref:ankyrin repeat domain-containing protein 37 n=1 Tax=Brachyhypopomus gauderio TaxID=698409 RepID=UPI00404146A6
MFLLESDSLDCTSSLLQAGYAVNGGDDARGQSPAHLAARGGDAFCLLWLLRTGADPNQRDAFGETPVHKAAKAGSLECVSVLAASHAQLQICNNDGDTAEDVAWSAGFQDCARFLGTLRATRRVQTDPSSCTVAERKRGRASSDALDGKRARGGSG